MGGGARAEILEISDAPLLTPSFAFLPLSTPLPPSLLHQPELMSTNRAGVHPLSPLLRDDPTVMSYQLANEPRAMRAVDAYRRWVVQTAGLIRRLSPNHLVTIGSEGRTPFAFSYVGIDPAADHAPADIDYMTIHVASRRIGLNYEMRLFGPHKDRGLSTVECVHRRAAGCLVRKAAAIGSGLPDAECFCHTTTGCLIRKAAELRPWVA